MPGGCASSFPEPGPRWVRSVATRGPCLVAPESPAARSVGLEPGRGHLHPDVVVPGLGEGADAVLDLTALAAVGVDVDRCGVPRLPAPQVVHGHSGQLALDVPQRLVDAAERVVEDGAVAPVRRDVAGLPDVLDVAGVPTDHEGSEVVVDGGQHGCGALGEGRAAHAVQLRLGRLDLHDHQPYAVGLREYDLDVPDERVGHVRILSPERAYAVFRLGSFRAQRGI